MSTFSLFSLFTARDVVKAVSSVLHLSPTKFDKDLENWDPSAYPKNTLRRWKLLLYKWEAHQGSYLGNLKDYFRILEIKCDSIFIMHRDTPGIHEECQQLLHDIYNKKQTKI